MAARRWENSLWVLKEKRNFVSPSDHVMFYLLYKHQWNTNHFTYKSFFGLKGAVYYEAIATMTFSHVKITCYFHMWRYQVFARKLIWFFIGVYIIKIVCLLIVHSSTLHWKNQSVVNKLQTGPAETSVQKTQIWESELISKG